MSRLSAHLHFGMVSPFRVARDALAAKSFGAGKFVDEYLTWREVAYAFCFYHCADLDTLKARGTVVRLPGRVLLYCRCVPLCCHEAIAKGVGLGLSLPPLLLHPQLTCDSGLATVLITAVPAC